jgi:hypothetical protein
MKAREGSVIDEDSMTGPAEIMPRRPYHHSVKQSNYIFNIITT